MGTYGLLRFGLPLVPKTASPDTIFNWLAVLSIVAILYGALVSLMQQDWKRLVAYSSVSHLGILHARPVRPESRRDQPAVFCSR
jgi:NADH-quinone oxidoreductase subunit M